MCRPLLRVRQTEGGIVLGAYVISSEMLLKDFLSAFRPSKLLLELQELMIQEPQS